MAIVDAWYRGSPWLWLLWPLSLLYRALSALRRRRLEGGREPRPQWPPLVVVGNITMGGTGKTPLVIALVKLLQAQGLRPGIVSRGYGGTADQETVEVVDTSSVQEVGDEAVLIRRSVSCPMFVDRNRVRAVQALLARHDCDIIISDDGLQHYAMPRQMEIVVLDGARLLGNGLLLPAGPLREPARRLREVDHVIVNGTASQVNSFSTPRSTMQLQPRAWINLRTGDRIALDTLVRGTEEQLHALAGIGNPERFFNSVRELGYDPLCHPFPDHYQYNAQDLRFSEEATVVMTGKDAVKCEHFAGPNYWYLAIEAQLEPTFEQYFLQRVRELMKDGAPYSHNTHQ